MYALGRQDLTQQGAGRSWVGVLQSSDLRVGDGGCGRAGSLNWSGRPHPQAPQRKPQLASPSGGGGGGAGKVGDSNGGSKGGVERRCRAGRIGAAFADRILFALRRR